MTRHRFVAHLRVFCFSVVLLSPLRILGQENTTSGDHASNTDSSAASDGTFNQVQGSSQNVEPTVMRSWCETQERWVAKGLQLRGAGCELGDCDFAANRDSWIPSSETPIRTFRIHVIVFAESNGSNPASTQEQVDWQMNQLNDDYAAARVFFCHTTEFVNDSTYRYFDLSQEASMKNTYARNPATQINVYVVDIAGSLLGVGTFPWDPDALTNLGGILIDETAFGRRREVLTHEVGHCLGLWHTHHGVSEVEQCSACYERADGVNGDATGDFASDTAPTPTNYACSGLFFQADPCSGTNWGRTDPENYMGYGQDACWSEFSFQQFGRMHCWSDEVLSSLSCGSPSGACCDGQACRLDTQAQCSASGGSYRGDWSRCEGVPTHLYCGDCNNNGMDDDCEVSCGATGGPCDLPGCGLGPDCNDNAILDSCDLLSTESNDCNSNQVPDECDTGAAASEDCNFNSTPDECEPLTEDCNKNGIRDDCDTFPGPARTATSTSSRTNVRRQTLAVGRRQRYIGAT